MLKIILAATLLSLAVSAGADDLDDCFNVSTRGMAGNVAETIRIARDLVDPDAPAISAGALGEFAMQLQAQGLNEPALACYRQAILRQPDGAQWTHLAAIASAENGDPGRAVDYFLSSLAADPNNRAARVRLATLLRDADRLDDATIILSPLAANVSDAGTAVALGQHAHAMGAYDEAIGWFQGALEAQPEATRIHYLLGQSLKASGDRDAAREQLRLAGEIGVQPPDPYLDAMKARTAGDVALVLRGKTAFAVGDLAAAAEAFEQARERNPDNAGASINLAAVRQAQGDADQALAILEEVNERFPDNATARFNLAALLEQDEAGRALALYQSLQGTAAEDGEVHLRIGMLNRRAGNLDAARQHLQMAQRDSSQFEAASLALIDMQMTAGDISGAIDQYQNLLAIAPASEEINLRFAELLAAGPDDALRDGRRAAELAGRVFQYQPSPRAARIAAMAHAQSDDCEVARAWLKRGAEIATDPVTAQGLIQIGRSLTATDCRP